MKVKFLGHIVLHGKIRPNPVKVASLTGYPTPTSKKELRLLMGKLGYFSDFVPRFAAMTEPLRHLQSSDVEWDWSQEQTSTLHSVLEYLLSEPALEVFNDKKPT